MGQNSSCEAAARKTVSRFRPRSEARRNSLTRATDSPSPPQSSNSEMASPSDTSSDSSVVEIAYQDLLVKSDSDPDPRNPSEADKIACKSHVLLVFPDVCPVYLEEIATEHQYQSDAIISAILDRQEEGSPYPIQPRENPLKRKRPEGEDELDDDDEEQENDPAMTVRKIRATVGTEGGLGIHSAGYINMATTLLSQDFPKAKLDTIKQYITSCNTSLFEAHIAMDEAVRNWNNETPPWKEKQRPTKKLEPFNRDKLPTLELSGYPPAQKAALVEMRAAREFRAIKDAEIAAEAEEQTNFVRAQSDGQTAECGICYDEYALNRMVRCEGETMHWFCRGCMRSQAETQVGMSKYELTCMSVDGCTAGFSRAQRALFLDKKLGTALDRIEQEAMLRMAGIENLETCPFCPYAAEYPPVEVDKEFRCDNPKCEQVSCRLCRRETHIPKTCAEAAEDRGVDARHILEEAMSAALIRRCNTCQNPFVKQDGCNKVVCTKCRTIMCDVCRQTVRDYSHFDDTRRGGKQGQCPLFDKSDARYDDEVREAEEKARKKVVEDNPQVDSDTLQFNVSEKIRWEEEKRRQENQHAARLGGARNNIRRPRVPQVVLQNMAARNMGVVDPDMFIQGPVPPPIPAPGGIPPPHLQAQNAFNFLQGAEQAQGQAEAQEQALAQAEAGALRYFDGGAHFNVFEAFQRLRNMPQRGNQAAPQPENGGGLFGQQVPGNPGGLFGQRVPGNPGGLFGERVPGNHGGGAHQPANYPIHGPYGVADMMRDYAQRRLPMLELGVNNLGGVGRPPAAAPQQPQPNNQQQNAARDFAVPIRQGGVQDRIPMPQPPQPQPQPQPQRQPRR